MDHRDEYVSKEHNRFQISIILRISFFLSDFEYHKF